MIATALPPKEETVVGEYRFEVLPSPTWPSVRSAESVQAGEGGASGSQGGHWEAGGVQRTVIVSPAFDNPSGEGDTSMVHATSSGLHRAAHVDGRRQVAVRSAAVANVSIRVVAPALESAIDKLSACMVPPHYNEFGLCSQRVDWSRIVLVRRAAVADAKGAVRVPAPDLGIGVRQGSKHVVAAHHEMQRRGRRSGRWRGGRWSCCASAGDARRRPA